MDDDDTDVVTVADEEWHADTLDDGVMLVDVDTDDVPDKDPDTVLDGDPEPEDDTVEHIVDDGDTDIVIVSEEEWHADTLVDGVMLVDSDTEPELDIVPVTETDGDPEYDDETVEHIVDDDDVDIEIVPEEEWHADTLVDGVMLVDSDT